MATRMLIDARHPEETRVAVLQGNRIEEFDFESAEHKQIKGNIYLAKVTRVEPSLQAAFVDFGGNRHGFLAFSEIHPDYYQIPVADRQALLAAQGYAQYEVSAYAQPGKAARHNLNYWTFGDFLGVGAGAHGRGTARQQEGAAGRPDVFGLRRGGGRVGGLEIAEEAHGGPIIDKPSVSDHRAVLSPPAPAP